jgi:RHS repeat-associated protein
LLSYYHQDQLGVRLTTDANGNVLTQQGTFPFGESWYQSSPGNKFVFTSYDRDSESQLDYALARYYNSGSGTFLMADPVAGNPGDPQSWNRYPYGRNDPINILDPSGKSWWSKLLIGIGIDIASLLLAPELSGIFSLGDGGAAAATVANTSFAAGFINSASVFTSAYGSSAFSVNGPSASSDPYSFNASMYYNGSGASSSSSSSSSPIFNLFLYYNGGGTNSATNSMAMFRAAPNNGQPKPKLCAGSFGFAGTELDAGVASGFTGAIVSSDVQGLDVGALNEVSVGSGEGGNAGVGTITSATTGQTSGFFFGGGKISLGPLGAFQIGALGNTHEFGLYIEGHIGTLAIGTGYAVTGCGR